MTAVATIPVQVTEIERITPLIKRFTLRRTEGGLLPPFSGGCHITVIMPTEDRIIRNPYSLLSSPRNLDSYQIAVRREEHSRGGSIYLHDRVVVGSRLEIAHPVNLFPLAKLARKHILVAGGVGITPMLAMIDDISVSQVPWELHFAVRSPEHAGFGKMLRAQHGERIQIYDSCAGRRLNFTALVDQQPLGTHLYVCGPASMPSDAFAAARAAGWPESHLHSEQFAHAPPGAAFEVHLNRSQRTIQVSPDQSLLEAMEAAGIEAPYLCRAGACGHCELNVISHDGELIHHDHWLSDEDRQSGQKIMPCVSRAKCTRLVLDW